jgi:hypothetical protein
MKTDLRISIKDYCGEHHENGKRETYGKRESLKAKPNRYVLLIGTLRFVLWKSCSS